MVSRGPCDSLSLSFFHRTYFQCGKVNNIVDVRVILENFVEIGFIGNITAVEIGSLAAD